MLNLKLQPWCSLVLRPSGMLFSVGLQLTCYQQKKLEVLSHEICCTLNTNLI